MSKDLAIAGVMVVSCLVVSAIAFVPPAKDTKAPAPALAGARKPLDLGTPKPPQPAQPVQTIPPPHPSGFEPLTPLPFDPPKPSTPAFPPSPATPIVTSKQPIIELPATPRSDEAKTHVVAKGEMLGDISLHYYGTSKRWQEIAKANPGIDPNGLRVGQKLVIPADHAKDAPTAAAPAQATAPTAPGERTYTVKEGDRYYTIAQRELGDASRWKELETLNKTASEDLRVGQVIKLPAKKEPATATAPVGAKPSAPIAADDGKKRHTVVEGDSLGEISMKYYGTSKRWKDIEKANPGIDSDRLIVGQKLIIPDVPADAPNAAKHEDPTAARPGAAAPAGDVAEYVVKAGDTLTAIADHFYHDKDHAGVERIQKANPGIDPHGLRVGQKLKIPGVKPDPAKAEKPTTTAPAKPVNPFAPTAPTAKPANPFTPTPPTAPPTTTTPPATAPNPFTTPTPTAPAGPNQATPRAPNPFAPGGPAGAPAKPAAPTGAGPAKPSPSPAPTGPSAARTPPPAAANPPATAKPTAPPAGKPTGGADPFAIDPLAPAPASADPGAPAPAKPTGTPDDPFKDFFAR